MATLASVTAESSPDSDLHWEEKVDQLTESETEEDLFSKASELLKNYKGKNPIKVLSNEFPHLSEEEKKKLISKLHNDGVPEEVYLKALKMISEKKDDYLLRKDLPDISTHVLNKLMKKLELEGVVEKPNSKNLRKGRKILKRDFVEAEEANNQESPNLDRFTPVKRSSILDVESDKKRKQSAVEDDIGSQRTKKSKSKKEE